MRSVRLYRGLLRLYPHAFYERYGDEMELVFMQALDEVIHQGRRKLLAFFLREFGGLLVSVVNAHWQRRADFMRRTVFNWRFMPVLLFGFSLIAATLFSLNYWGYLVVPSSTFNALHSVESIVLVEFDDEYKPTRIPIERLPALVTEVFPPSQILPLVEQSEPDAEISPSLDPVLTDMLAATLAAEGIELAVPTIEYPTKPVFNPNGCGTCWWNGIQRQPDGSLLEIWPPFDVEGSTDETRVYRLTPEDWRYYHYFAPVGYVVEGHGTDGTPLVFTAIASGAISNDHYRYYEFVFAQEGNRLIPQQRLSYAFDIAGIEGLNFPMLTMLCFVPLFILYLIVVIMSFVFAFVIRRTARWRSIGRA